MALAVSEATRHQIDFDIYRMGAAHVAGQNLYNLRLPRSLMGGRRGMHFTYPPFAALLFWPFANIAVAQAQIVWSILNILGLGALIALSIHAARPDWPPRLLWTVAAIALFPAVRLDPAALTLAYGQVNFLIVVLVLLDLTSGIRWRSHTLPRGVLLGVAAAIKLTPLIFVPFLFLTRQFRAGITALTTFLLCSLGTFAIASHSSILYWSTEIFEAKRSGNLLFISDQNLHSAVQRIIGTPPAVLLLVVLTAIFAIGGVAVAALAYRLSSPLLGVIVCAATALVISPISWAHHYVWIVPVLVWLTLGSDRPPGWQWWAVGAAALFYVAPIWWIPDPQQGYGGPFTVLAGNSFFLAAVTFILGTAVRLLKRGPAPVALSPS